MERNLPQLPVEREVERDERALIEVVVLHHALGLTSGVIAFAGVLRSAGHAVHTPDLYRGRSFESIEEGVTHAEEIGFSEIIERGVRAFDERPGSTVVVGVSLGVLPAQMIAQSRSHVLDGAVLVEACVPVDEFGSGWAGSLPTQIHGMDADPFFAGDGDIDHARAIAEGHESVELHVYPGDRHLFVDRSLPSFEPDAAERFEARVLRFLEQIGTDRERTNRDGMDRERADRDGTDRDDTDRDGTNR